MGRRTLLAASNVTTNVEFRLGASIGLAIVRDDRCRGPEAGLGVRIGSSRCRASTRVFDCDQVVIACNGRDRRAVIGSERVAADLDLAALGGSHQPSFLYETVCIGRHGVTSQTQCTPHIDD